MIKILKSELLKRYKARLIEGLKKGYYLPTDIPRYLGYAKDDVSFIEKQIPELMCFSEDEMFDVLNDSDFADLLINKGDYLYSHFGVGYYFYQSYYYEIEYKPIGVTVFQITLDTAFKLL